MKSLSPRPILPCEFETITGDGASASSYRDAVKTGFDVTVDFRHLVLYQTPAGARGQKTCRKLIY
jgi:hypothetical protein